MSGRNGRPTEQEHIMCHSRSPQGNLVCSRRDCDGVGHVWEHPSAAYDGKVEADAVCDEAA